jgi:hypothetical protein
MTQPSKLATKTNEKEEIIRKGNEGEASVKEDLGDLQEEQTEKKKNKGQQLQNDPEKSSIANRSQESARENEEEDEGSGKS